MAMTFRVNLSTVNELAHKPPYNQTEGVNFPKTRDIYIPNSLNNNRYKSLKHGDTFTVSGSDAIYLKNMYTTGQFKCLDYVGGTAV